MTQPSDDTTRSTPDAWLSAAYDALTDSGVDAVKIMPLAKKLGLTRTGFYWYFKDRDALLEAMIADWEKKNTGNLVARCNAYASGICEALYNLFDCWVDDELFDSRLDLAIRNWARNDPALQARLTRADASRKAAMQAMFMRFGHDQQDAEVRALTMIYTQIGYFSMQVTQTPAERFAQMPHYIEVFTGKKPTRADHDRFVSRHRAKIKPIPRIRAL